MKNGKTIWKFKLYLKDRQTINTPAGSKFLTVNMQNNDLVIYAVVDTEIPEELIGMREIAIVETGSPMPDGDVDYIGTVTLPLSGYVLHVFEVR